MCSSASSKAIPSPSATLSQADILAQAATLLVEIAGPEPAHVEMSPVGPQKHLTNFENSIRVFEITRHGTRIRKPFTKLRGIVGKVPMLPAAPDKTEKRE